MCVCVCETRCWRYLGKTTTPFRMWGIIRTVIDETFVWSHQVSSGTSFAKIGILGDADMSCVGGRPHVECYAHPLLKRISCASVRSPGSGPQGPRHPYPSFRMQASINNRPHLPGLICKYLLWKDMLSNSQ